MVGNIQAVFFFHRKVTTALEFAIYCIDTEIQLSDFQFFRAITCVLGEKENCSSTINSQLSERVEDPKS